MMARDGEDCFGVHAGFFLTYPAPSSIERRRRGLKKRLEMESENQYNANVKVKRLLPPRERSPIVAAPPRLEVMTARLAGWVIFSGIPARNGILG